MMHDLVLITLNWLFKNLGRYTRHVGACAPWRGGWLVWLDWMVGPARAPRGPQGSNNIYIYTYIYINFIGALGSSRRIVLFYILNVE